MLHWQRAVAQHDIVEGSDIEPIAERVLRGCPDTLDLQPADHVRQRAADPTDWIIGHRRCARDYERVPDHHAALVR